MSLPSLLAIKGELSRRSLRAFFEYFAWPVLQPGRPFKSNWHIDAMCDHLEAVARGEIKKLLINIPPRHLKSSIVSQAFPAWIWEAVNPSMEFMTASYAKDLATRDAVESRKIIESPEYQAAYGDLFQMSGDQNVKTRYQNDKHGQRFVTATEASGTGFGGDLRIIDDPVSAKDADSLVKLKSSIEFWKGTMSTRGNDPENAPAIITHQRMHVDDLTGYCLTQESGWEHLIIPHRYDPKRAKVTVLGWSDPRKVEGELLHPSRIGEVAMSDLEKTLGVYHTRAQLGQNPEPRGGIIFKRQDWKFYRMMPAEIDEVILSIDCTFKDAKTSDHVAIQAWMRKGSNCYLFPKRIKERLGFAATVQATRTFAAMVDMVLPGKRMAIYIEDKANGSAVIETLKSELTSVLAVQPEGGKAARAFAVQPMHEAGNVWVPDPELDPSIESFIGTCAAFTGAEGGDDDEVDSMTQGLNQLRKRTASLGILRWYEGTQDRDEKIVEATAADEEKIRKLATGG